LELKRYFGIAELLDEKTADKIWKKANEKLANPELTTQGILKNSCQGRLHHGRSGGQSGTSPRVRVPGPSDENVACVPARQGADGPSARQFQPVGGTACRCPATWTSTAFPCSSPRCESATIFSIRKAAVYPIMA